MATNIIGLYPDQASAQPAIERLRALGYEHDSIQTANASTDFTRFGAPETDARTFSEFARRGGYVFVARVENAHAAQAQSLLEETGSYDYDHLENSLRGNPGDTIERVREDLQIGKREVETGGVRVRQYVHERPVEAGVELREEHVTIERRAVDRPATAGTMNAFQEGTIEVRETAEVPVVAKEARVIEEIAIGKTTDVRTETVRDTLRETEVEVEQIPGQTLTTSETVQNVRRDDGARLL